MNVQLTKEQLKFLKGNSSIVTTEEESWYYMPYWWKENKEVGENIFEITTFDNLPEHIKQLIQDSRK